jgi:predicted ATP-grasp superfamily ATP-dependent carboligase
MLYADQLGLSVPDCSATSGIGSVRMVTDLPAAMTAILAGDTGLGDYFCSLRKCRTEAVFSSDDLWPGLVEILLIPYLAVKRGP